MGGGDTQDLAKVLAHSGSVRSRRTPPYFFPHILELPGNSQGLQSVSQQSDPAVSDVISRHRGWLGMNKETKGRSQGLSQRRLTQGHQSQVGGMVGRKAVACKP